MGLKKTMGVWGKSNRIVGKRQWDCGEKVMEERGKESGSTKKGKRKSSSSTKEGRGKDSSSTEVGNGKGCSSTRVEKGGVCSST